MHDIGNAINRNHHAEYGALLANDLLKDTNMSLEDRVTVIAAIGNHEEARKMLYQQHLSLRTKLMSEEAVYARRKDLRLIFTIV